jgi:hypothetical protein
MTHQPRASFTSPRFAQPATFMRLPLVEDPHGLDVAIVGVPYDGGIGRARGSDRERFVRSRRSSGPGQITALLAANLMFEFVCVLALGRIPNS